MLKIILLYYIMYGRDLRDRLPQFNKNLITTNNTSALKQAKIRDTYQKQKIRQYANRHTKPSLIQVGDRVLLRRKRINKFTPRFGLTKFTVVRRNK